MLYRKAHDNKEGMWLVDDCGDVQLSEKLKM